MTSTIPAGSTCTQIEPTADSLSVVAATHGAFYLAAGVWPLLHYDSFQAVTGSRLDLWLAYAVGLVVAAVGGGLLVAALRRRVTGEVGVFAVGAALALAAIDVVFVTRGVISPVYLADAAVEGILVGWWGVAWFPQRTA